MSRLMRSGHDDAFGQALHAFLRGETNHYIIERDDGFIEIGWDIGTYFSQPEDWWPIEREALERVERGTRSLDLGCGAGRHSLFLQNRGIKAVGIDNSAGAIEICRLKGLQKARHIDVRALRRDLRGEKFDLVIMMGHNFGLMGSFGFSQKLLRDLAELTTPDGQITGTVLDPYHTDNSVHLAYHERNRRLGRMPCQITMRVRYKQFIGPWFNYLFLSPEELEKIVARTPWQVDLVQYDDNHTSYLLKLTKK